MKIQKIKINGFGKIQNKEWEFNNKINLIQGENESGKSTLLKFILAMFYGTSRNKNGKFLSDFERYKPWNTEEYSGKIEYELDNGEKYEVFREFKRKAPKIYDEKEEEITKNYSTDKSKESTFFEEQTGIKEDNFFATSAVEQGEIRLDKSMKNVIIQKLSNMATTGNENISYKKAIEKLSKKQMEEIGTDRSTGRPINVINQQIRSLEDEKEKLKKYEEKANDIEKNKELIEQDIDEDINVLELLRRQKTELEKIEIEKTKIQLIEREIENLDNQEKDSERPKKPNKIRYIIPIILVIAIVLISILIKKPILSIVGIIPLIYFVMTLISNNKKSSAIIKTDNKDKIKKYEQEKENYIKEINERKRKVKEDFKEKIDTQILEEILSLKYEKIVEYIDEKEREVVDFKVGKRETEIKREAMEEKIERLIEIEEKLSTLKDERLELNNLNNIYEIVKEEIMNSYQEIRENITPDFLDELKNIIKEVTDNKYNNLSIDKENEIKIELENGNFIGIDHLSTGTIDLIYLALRMSASKEITNEKMPIILDESFAYYDDYRLENIIKYIVNKYDNQVFILTCSNREKEILNKMNMKYNLIQL